MKTLPKYFVVKRDNKNPLWKEYINWLNKKIISNIEGNNYNYYGYDGNYLLLFDFYNNISDFDNNPTLLTLEEWNELKDKPYIEEEINFNKSYGVGATEIGNMKNEEQVEYFVVYIEDRQAPTKRHTSFEEAKKEALKMTKQYNQSTYVSKLIFGVEIGFKEINF